jgi:hypothetical protein
MGTVVFWIDRTRAVQVVYGKVYLRVRLSVHVWGLAFSKDTAFAYLSSQT